MLFEIFIPAFVIGLLGAGHCLGMCGGITAALSFGVGEGVLSRKLSILFTYNVGRITSYVMVGAIAGGLGYLLEPLLSNVTSLPILRLLAGVMLLLMGFYISGWWQVLSQLERVGGFVWRYIQPLSARLFPIESLGKALIVGMLWGWLPCGLVYSALVYALAQGDLVSSMLVMLAFGLGTMPALLLGGLAGAQLKALLQKAELRAIMGVILIVAGLATMFFALQHGQHHEHDKHHDHNAPTSGHQHH